MDTDLCLRRPFRGPQGTGVFGGAALENPTGPETPSRSQMAWRISGRAGWGLCKSLH